MSRGGFEQSLASGLVGLIVLGVILAAWVVTKALELIIRVMVAHPTNRPLWAGVLVTLVCLSLAAAAQFQSQSLNTLWSLSFWGLVVLAKIVETYYDQLLLRDWSRAEFAHAVTHEPWWSI